MKYRAFIRALGIPDGAAAHQLFDAAVRDGVKTTAEAKRIFLETKRADMREQVKAANEEGQRKKTIYDPMKHGTDAVTIPAITVADGEQKALVEKIELRARRRYTLPPMPEVSE